MSFVEVADKFVAKMTAITCGECGIPWSVPENWRQERRKDGVTFYCPNGHARVYRKTVEDELREQVERLQGERDRAEAGRLHQMAEKRLAKRQAAAQKGLRTRLRNQILRGLCPQCGETFRQVRRHILRKHPDLLKELRR